MNYVIDPEASIEERQQIHEKGEKNASPGILILVCNKCTRMERFPAKDRAIAGIAAHRSGWEYRKDGKTICPRCPK